MTCSPVTRFAPSPTGRLHLGHVRSAHDGWRRARAGGGRFLLRIEDIDPGRCRPDHEAAILDDLRWLGLHWDGPVWRQSGHMPEYRAALDRLAERELLFPCFCTRADVLAAVSAPHAAPDGSTLYPGTCRRLDPAERRDRVSAGEPHALRLDMASALRIAGPLSRVEEGRGRVACHPGRFGDIVLARKDVPASYHLCSTHDDALQDVTLVTRGIDLEPCADLHRLLQHLFGWPEPGYAHHPLVLGPDGSRLAKRDGAVSVRALRDMGLAADEVLRRAAAD
ncbi:MAG: tRNA glutamyl-Q(34) synthetase GluQRS [Gluconacetobacter diazotrophicus]|nr:tRNA glutamyl-Q(34) synthetase GluQRS [Gluconacetobacter diazotrophicus]